MGFISNLLNRWKSKDNKRLQEMADQLKQSKLSTNSFTISDQNARSWAPDLHPNGIEPSSRVATIDYNAETKDLDVTFRDGASITYPNIDESTAKAFENADSKGRFVNNVLKDKQYF